MWIKFSVTSNTGSSEILLRPVSWHLTVLELHVHPVCLRKPESQCEDGEPFGRRDIVDNEYWSALGKGI